MTKPNQTEIISSEPQRLVSFLNPLLLFTNLWSHRELISQLTKREIKSRYQGSFLGILWSFITPIIMLIIYTFVFSVILQCKWGMSKNESQSEFALTLFCGLIVYSVFSECVGKSPTMVLSSENLVKRVVFPLEILPLIHLGSALFHNILSVLILICGIVILLHSFSISVFIFPLIMVQLSAFTLGLCWIISSLGVFYRDINHAVSLIVQMLFFLTPIFYPISIVPDYLKIFIKINPLAFMVDSSRKTLVWGDTINWKTWLVVSLISFVVMEIGYIWFMKTKRGFSDVI